MKHQIFVKYLLRGERSGVWERVANRYGCDVKKTFDGRIFVKHQIFVKYLLVGERFGVWERVANR